jgi:hypothetical protein
VAAHNPYYERNTARKGLGQGRREQDSGDRPQGAAGRGLAEESGSLCIPDPHPALMPQQMRIIYNNTAAKKPIYWHAPARNLKHSHSWLTFLPSRVT